MLNGSRRGSSAGFIAYSLHDDWEKSNPVLDSIKTTTKQITPSSFCLPNEHSCFRPNESCLVKPIKGLVFLFFSAESSNIQHELVFLRRKNKKENIWTSFKRLNLLLFCREMMITKKKKKRERTQRVTEYVYVFVSHALLKTPPTKPRLKRKEGRQNAD